MLWKILSVCILVAAVAGSGAQAQERFDLYDGWDTQIDFPTIASPTDVIQAGTIFVWQAGGFVKEYDWGGYRIDSHSGHSPKGTDHPGSPPPPFGPDVIGTNGSYIRQYDIFGTLVPGGINITPTYGTISDIDRTNAGVYWITDEATGDFSTVDVTTNTVTTQFVLPGFGTSCFCVRGDNGNILLAVSPTNPGGFLPGTLLEVDTVGNIIAIGNGPSSDFLLDNRDPCVTSGQSIFNQPTGFAWIDAVPVPRLAMSHATVVNGTNLFLFVPQGQPIVKAIGPPDYTPGGFHISTIHSGGGVIGSSGFSVSLFLLHPSVVPTAQVFSIQRDCANPTFPGVLGTLYVDPFAPSGSAVITQNQTFAVDLTSIPMSLADTDLYNQFLIFDLVAVQFQLTRAFRVELQ